MTSSLVENVVISGAGHTAMAETGKAMTVTQFDLAKLRSDWFRITLRDAAGRWRGQTLITNAI